MKRYIHILQVLTIVLFMGVMLTPMLNSQLGLINEISGNENRAKATKPIFDLNNLDDFTKDYDTYYTDNFNLRQNFISLINRFDYTFFKISPVPHRVTVGKDGWFYATKSAKNYKGDNLFSRAQMSKLKEELENRTKWAKANGADYYLVIVPNKMNMYPEHLPGHIIRISDSTRYDQVVNLDHDSAINVIDLRQNLLLHKNDGYDIYQHTDDHWNDLGAYYGYQAIMNRLSQKYPQLRPQPLSNFEIGIRKKSGNMAQIINADLENPEYFVELKRHTPKFAIDGEKHGYGKNIDAEIQDEKEIVKVNDHGGALKCLIIRDSFTKYLIDFIPEHFKETVFIHDGWTYQMHEDIIKTMKPNVVLNIVLETEVYKLLEHPFLKTVDMYYYDLKSNPSSIERMTRLANERHYSVEDMTKLTALWLFNDQKSKGEKVVVTPMYFEFLYQVDDKYTKLSQKYANEKKLTFEEAASVLAKKAYEENRNDKE